MGSTSVLPASINVDMLTLRVRGLRVQRTVVRAGL